MRTYIYTAGTLLKVKAMVLHCGRLLHLRMYCTIHYPSVLLLCLGSNRDTKAAIYRCTQIVYCYTST